LKTYFFEMTSLEYGIHDDPRSIASYASGTAKVVLAHILGLVKSYHPTMDVRPLVDGAVGDCIEEQFNKYHREVEPVAHEIVDDLDLF
jgi:hypothetical protein